MECVYYWQTPWITDNFCPKYWQVKRGVNRSGNAQCESMKCDCVVRGSHQSMGLDRDGCFWLCPPCCCSLVLLSRVCWTHARCPRTDPHCQWPKAKGESTLWKKSICHVIPKSNTFCANKCLSLSQELIVKRNLRTLNTKNKRKASDFGHCQIHLDMLQNGFKSDEGW